jgi:hypothetical protein
VAKGESQSKSKVNLEIIISNQWDQRASTSSPSTI